MECKTIIAVLFSAAARKLDQNAQLHMLPLYDSSHFTHYHGNEIPQKKNSEIEMGFLYK